MSEEYVTVRIPQFFDDLIKKYIAANQEEMRLLGLRTSRASVVKQALYEFLKKGGVVQEQPVTQKDVSNQDDFFLRSKEIFLAHSIIKLANGKTLPPNHLDLKELEQSTKKYITKRAEKTGNSIKKQEIEALSKELVEYHKEIVEGLDLIS